jgi:hypothetical protein
MKSEVDSSQKKLPYPVIITQAILAQEGAKKEDVSKSMLFAENLLAKPGAKKFQKNNTVFIVNFKENEKSALVVPYNLDSKPKYIQNSVSLIERLIDLGITKGVISGVDKKYLDVYIEIKNEMGKLNVAMGISQTKDVITSIWDSDIQKRS